MRAGVGPFQLVESAGPRPSVPEGFGLATPFYFCLAMPHGLWDLSFLTRN